MVWAGAPQRGRRLRTAGCSASADWRPSPIPTGAVRVRSSQATLALLEPQATPTSCCHSFRRECLRMYWHTCWRVRSRCVRCPALEAHPTQHAACHNCAARMPRSLLPGTGLQNPPRSPCARPTTTSTLRVDCRRFQWFLLPVRSSRKDRRRFVRERSKRSIFDPTL